MERLTKEEVLSLREDDKFYYHIVLSRLFTEAPVFSFSGRSQLHIRRVAERLISVTPVEVDWAEGSYLDVEPDGSVVVEDYKMVIFK